MNVPTQTVSKPAVRLVHVSDIHLTAHPLGWQRADWFNKRLAAWFNLRCLGRGYRFRHADQVMEAWSAEIQMVRPDRVIFSGDATALGFEAEVARAAYLLGVGADGRMSGLAVPGNHDYCTRAAAVSGGFEKYFSRWQEGERIDGSVYPFAQRVGPLWLVAVNSSVANRWPWDASGQVGADQLQRLELLLRRLAPGLRILVTHYPVCLASGQPERHTHGLRDLLDLLRVAADGGICLWLHGHRHGAYHHHPGAHVPFPVICAGSATQSRLWSYGHYTIDGRRLHAVRRAFDPRQCVFRDAESFDIELSGAY